MQLWKIATAHLLVIALAGCTSTAKLTSIDRALVGKNIARLPSGGVEITLDGAFLMNPTAAVETFHTVAEKELGGRPYRYSYAVANKPLKGRAGSAAEAKASDATAEPASTHAGYPSYTPIYVPRSPGGSGIGSGEAAIILGSLALIILIAKLASKDKKQPVSAAPGTAQASTSPTGTAIASAPGSGILQVRGTAEPVEPVTVDRSRLVEVIIPEGNAAIGTVKPALARKIAEEIRSGLEELGCQVLLAERAQKAGYIVRTTVLRAQGNALMYANFTIEVALEDQRTGRELARWLVQAGEKPFDLKTQNERLYGGTIPTSILQKPLRTQLHRYLR